VNCMRGAVIPAALLTVLSAGCSEVSSYAVPTSQTRLPPRVGAVAIYATRPPPVGTELGIVEARGGGAEGGVDVLFPELVRRAQQLGANALVIDWMGAKIELVQTWGQHPMTFPCGRGYCTTWDTYPTTQQVMTVVLRGRALSVPEGEAAP
jgi:hypothetical protein